jgi:hypothetical protein
VKADAQVSHSSGLLTDSLSQTASDDGANLTFLGAGEKDPSDPASTVERISSIRERKEDAAGKKSSALHLSAASRESSPRILSSTEEGIFSFSTAPFRYETRS